VFALGIAAERLWYFFVTIGIDANQFFEQLREHLRGRQWDAAHALCEATRGPVARITHAGLLARDQQAEEIGRIMEEAAHEELPQIERHHRWLATIAQVSTLLGLLGTVIGMVVAFQVIQQKATSTNPVSPADLAGGIWQALITTVAGLGVAIPTILAYNYLVGRVTEVQYQMERAAALVAGWRRSAEAGSQRPAHRP
jgi:biopolymer transport protein ExbB